MMNKFIHHNVVMRWLSGVFGVLCGPVVVIYAMIMSIVFNKRMYYFGLFPSYIPMTLSEGDSTIQAGGSDVAGPAESWLMRIYEVILQLSSPLTIITDMFTIENFTLEGSNAYRAFRDHVRMVYEGSINLPRLNVELMERVRAAGKESSLDSWSGAMQSLEGEFGAHFTRNKT